MGNPSIKIQWDNAVGWHPFAVIFSSKMDMGACRTSTFTRGMANRIARLQQLTHGYPVFGFNVEVKNHPTSALIPITIQVEHNRGIIRAGHYTRGNGSRKFIGRDTAAAHSPGSKIDSG
jgi:hypothetical protein